MSVPVVLSLLWLVAANVIAMFPSRRQHWPAAYALIAIGLPLLGWLLAVDGVWAALLVAAAGASVLRWPVRYLGRWLIGLVRRRKPDTGGRNRDAGTGGGR